MSVARRPLLMLSLATTIALICAGFNFVVDPYGAWGTGLVAPAFGKINDDRLQIPYLLRTSAPETVLVGSSRVAWGIPIEEGYRDGLLNAGIRGASLPQVVRIIDLALAGPHLKRLVWFVDFFAFSSRYHNHDPHFDARMDGSFEAKIEETLFSLNALGDSYDTLKRALGGRARLRRTRTVPIPWPMDFICHEIDIKATSDLSTVPDFVIAMQLTRNWYADYQISPALVRLFSTTVQHARAQGVEVVPVIAPMSQYEPSFCVRAGNGRDFRTSNGCLLRTGPFGTLPGTTRLRAATNCFAMQLT